MDNNNPQFFSKSAKEAAATANVKVALRQQVKSTNFKMTEKKSKMRFVASVDPNTASSASSADGDNSTTASQDGTNKSTDSKDVTGEQPGAEDRTSDYKSEDDQLIAVQQIVEENLIKEGDKAPDQAERNDQGVQETITWELNFKDKIGEIKSKDEEPLHVFKQNVRFYQDRETNTFNPRMMEFAIEIKGDHAKNLKKEKGKPNQEVFHLNYLNLCQYLRKREMNTEVDVGDHEFHMAELLQKQKEEQE